MYTGTMVESSNGGVVESFLIVEWRNGGAVALLNRRIVDSNGGVVESSIRRIVEWWNDGMVELSNR